MFSRALLMAGLCAALSSAAAAETVTVKYRGPATKVRAAIKAKFGELQASTYMPAALQSRAVFFSTRAMTI